MVDLRGQVTVDLKMAKIMAGGSFTYLQDKQVDLTEFIFLF